MRYWWVNQNQTFRHELNGGCSGRPIATPMVPATPFYETMREISSGDVIFSFVDTRIAAIRRQRYHVGFTECDRDSEGSVDR
jgi:putative restriction endonuclease